ncbi:BTB/POZ domain-containing protein [Nymphaea thermarum]|nr:BTB/POZ domain-containing protein [Nymphaea thermarum]
MKDRIKLNVGGRIFETTTTTLANAGRNSLFGAMFDDQWNPRGPMDGGQDEYFIDRNPGCFSVLLDLLRTGELHIPANLPEHLLYREALYYGLLDHVRAAKWGEFDGNRVKLATSVRGRAPGDGTAIRAGPDGGCVVAHGSMVHVYSWTMEQLPPLNLNYQRINDMGFVDAHRVAVCACERIDRGDGGMGMFNSSTGELLYKFQVSHENQPKSFSAGALSFSPESGQIFASCRGRSNEYGIGVWDGYTGKQTDFYYETAGWSIGDSGRLQCLPNTNLLFVATLYPRTENCYIQLLDFREKNAVWSWSDVGWPATIDEKMVLDAIVMEDGNSICVVNQYDDLGFMDLRSNGGSVRWSTRSRLLKMGNADERCYPKLATHGGQLFASTNDSISVFCGPDWVLTSRLRRSHGGSICDFSIGGDRLFVLHNEEDVFDVWETPPLRALS